MDTDIREELIQAIIIVAASTGLTVNQCIQEALIILKDEQEKYERLRDKNVYKYQRS